ncbi:MAG: DUF924 domain-containing protein [Gammaproteobacteria bacterium]|nr:MAG: DUF924 domain-containing protein [Gammaproteobacteria bacterium]UTW42582.1 DUF924 domain-containing protein [bacterium SCSIO 12844]
MINIDQNQVINFWFEELSSRDWFKKSDALDAQIKMRFLDVYNQAIQDELWQWRENAEGALAEIIILDQFSRNIYRNQKEAFMYDSLALALAQNAVSLNFHLKLDAPKHAFLLMPYMHSESIVIHHQAIKLFDVPGLENNLAYEYKHFEIIKQFSRYPHRNEILGRESTADELKFLQTHGGF